MTQTRVNSLDILLVFCLGFLPPLYSNTAYRQKCKMYWFHHVEGYFFLTSATSRDTVYGQEPNHRPRVSFHCGVFLVYNKLHRPQ